MRACVYMLPISMFYNLFSRMSMLLQINDIKTALKRVLFCGVFLELRQNISFLQ